MTSRRDFLRYAGGMFAVGAVTRQDTTQHRTRPADPAAVGGDTLPASFGRDVAPVGPLDNDGRVVAIERRLRCTCGCTLDVYTCRTTDFSCTYSPAMHRDVVARIQAGATAEQIVQSFVDQYGETVLMAAPPRGFNLAGYLLPGVSVTVVALALLAWLLRNRAANAPVPAPAVPRGPDAEDLERLRRALDDVES